MKKASLEQALSLAQKLRHIFVATANAAGLPHIAAAGKLTSAPFGRVALSAWFCPTTVANLQTNRRVSLVIWDAQEDIGHQLIGEIEKMEEMAMMDGYAPEKESGTSLPQVERRLLIHVDQIIRFSHAPHSDVEESG